MKNDNIANKLAKKSFESEAIQKSWNVHMNVFAPILENAFKDNYVARVELTAALNLLSNRQLKKALKKLEILEHRCVYDEDKACYLYFMGLCFEMANMKEETVSFYQNANQFNHSFYLPYLKVARYAHNDGVFEIAQENYIKAIECLKNEILNEQIKTILASTYTNYASCLTMMHNYDDAIKQIELSKQILEFVKSRSISEAIIYAAKYDEQKAYLLLEKVKEENDEGYNQTKSMIDEILNKKHPHFNQIPVSKENIELFWNWFVDNESLFLKKLLNNKYDDIFAMIQFKLKTVFPFVERELDLAIELKNNYYQIIFTDYFMVSLKEGYRQLINEMPDSLKEHWYFDITR